MAFMMWRSVAEPNNVFFLFAVASMEEAQRLIDSPEFAQAEKDSGVIDGEYHFVESARGY